VALSVLFAEFLDETGCLCLRLEADGIVTAPLMHRCFDEIQTMQSGTQTLVVLSTTMCGLHRVELPWLGDKKARAAIPFALEEQLAQKLTSLHFAFDRAHHQENFYLVVVIDKTYLSDVMARLDEHHIFFNEITIDWFALRSGESSLTPSALLVRDENYQGALSGELLSRYLSELNEPSKVLAFTDSPTKNDNSRFTMIDEPFYQWAARRLQQSVRINLCQAELSHGLPSQGNNRRWMIMASALAGLWLLSILVFNGVNLIRLHHQLNQIDKETAIVYRQFFPNAQQVISPRFRIHQLLKTGGVTQSNLILWRLLDKLDKTVDLNMLTVEQLQYKNKMLSVMVKARDFGVLEALSARLQKEGVKVLQTQASSHEKDVTATLELR